MKLHDHKPEDSQVLQVNSLGDDHRLCEHLTLGEFKSRDGYGLCMVHPALLTGFILIRRGIGVRMKIQSGFRSDPHNARIGGSPTSFHRIGMAIDLRPVVPEDEMLLVLMGMQRLATEIGMGGVRLYQEESFLHIDVGPKRTW